MGARTDGQNRYGLMIGARCGKDITMAARSGIDDLGLDFSPELDAADQIDFSTLAQAAQDPRV